MHFSCVLFSKGTTTKEIMNFMRREVYKNQKIFSIGNGSKAVK